MVPGCLPNIKCEKFQIAGGKLNLSTQVPFILDLNEFEKISKLKVVWVYRTRKTELIEILIAGSKYIN